MLIFVKSIRMKKGWLYLFLLLCFIGCGQRNTYKSATSRLDYSTTKEQHQAKTENDTNTLVPVKEDLVHPTWGTIATDFKYFNFGRIGYFDRSFKDDTLAFPPIKGLVHKCAYAMCPTDTCFSEYVVLALRCPPVQPLLNWLSDTVHTYLEEFPVGQGLSLATDKRLSIPKKYMKSDKALCNYYINQLQHVYDGWHCTGDDDHDRNVINSQAGLLISDCWNAKGFYTFYILEWADNGGNGYNARESYLTRDAATGKALGLQDFVPEDKLDRLAALVMPRLINGKKEYYIRQVNVEPKDYISILNRADGCALIAEGLIFYYYAYNIGFGCDGQYEAVVPYEELDGVLNKRWIQ